MRPGSFYAASPRRLLAFAAALAGASCGESLPPDVEGYEARCIKMSPEPIPPYDGDPHRGMKNVYACGVDRALVEANARPFPDGTMIVKDSTRDGTRWLIATARKQGGAWRWDEYTRNFDNEEFVHIVSGQGVCVGCHERARTFDYIYTRYVGPPP